LSCLGALGEGLVELSFDRDDASATVGFGGDAGNVCVMAARLGARARIGGRVGEDAFGEALLGFWAGRGVEVDHLVRDSSAPTGLYLNESRDGGGHRFVYYRTGSAGSRLRPADVGERFYAGLGALAFTGVTLAISESAAASAEAACERAERLGVELACVLNHRPALGGDGERLARLARRCRLVLGSREDAEALFGTGEPDELAAALGSRVEEVVLSDGPGGAVAIAGGERLVQPAPAVTVANAAGAGDALAGAYLAARLNGATPGRALAVAVAASSLSVTRAGCAGSYPSAEQVARAVEQLPSLSERSDR
jgi:2-dehydro-3-deoxygluconokinase